MSQVLKQQQQQTVNLAIDIHPSSIAFIPIDMDMQKNFGILWKSEKPRLRFTYLPCLKDYYKAAQLKYLVNWCNPHYSPKSKELDQRQLL